MRCVSDPRYLKRDRERTASVIIGAGKPKVYFKSSKTVSREDSSKHELLHVVVRKRIKAGEELSVEYGESCML